MRQNEREHTSQSRESAEPRYIVAASGAVVDVSGSEWKIGVWETLNWKLMPFALGNGLTATKHYFRVFLTKSSPRYVEGQFTWLLAVFNAAVCLGVDINDIRGHNITLFYRVREFLENRVSRGTVGNYLDAYRRWYMWCCEMEFDDFDEEVATVLDNTVIGGNLKGAAVLRDDPNEGPLRRSELHMVSAHLRSAVEERLLPVEDLVAVALQLAFGTNPKNLVLLNDEDLIKTRLSDGSIVYEIRMPRIKKRGKSKLRHGYRTRILLPEIGQLVEELIATHESSDLGTTEDNRAFERPLFRRSSPVGSLKGTYFETDAYRVTTQCIREALNLFVDYFDLRAIDGSRLELTPRRLRYSFATRLVQEGASMYELADALDHSDCQHVMVYFNSRSDSVVALDTALEWSMMPAAKAFMGCVVVDEDDAVRGNDRASRIKLRDQNSGAQEGLGTCGSFGFCKLFAPIACYTCFKFQPWLDGPHEFVLIELLRQREERQHRGADPRMIQIHDDTIVAVKKVIEICNEWRDWEPGDAA